MVLEYDFMTLIATVTFAIVVLSSCPFTKSSLEALSVFHLIGGKAIDSSSWCKSLFTRLFLRLIKTRNDHFEQEIEINF